MRDAEPGSVERDEALQVADAEFRKFKRELLGGTYRAWLTEWANPSDEQLDRLRGPFSLPPVLCFPSAPIRLCSSASSCLAC